MNLKNAVCLDSTTNWKAVPPPGSIGGGIKPEIVLLNQKVIQEMEPNPNPIKRPDDMTEEEKQEALDAHDRAMAAAKDLEENPEKLQMSEEQQKEIQEQFFREMAERQKEVQRKRAAKERRLAHEEKKKVQARRKKEKLAKKMRKKNRKK